MCKNECTKKIVVFSSENDGHSFKCIEWKKAKTSMNLKWEVMRILVNLTREKVKQIRFGQKSAAVPSLYPVENSKSNSDFEHAEMGYCLYVGSTNPKLKLFHLKMINSCCTQMQPIVAVDSYDELKTINNNNLRCNYIHR